MITPPFLKPGDKVAIVATARKVSFTEMEPAIQLFRAWGLTVVTGNNITAEESQYAGTDEQRTSDMQQMLDDADVMAIFCARGGYGSVRIIDRLDFTKFVASPKWIVGYSDITVFHSHIHRHFGIETLHGPMPINFPANGIATPSIESLRKTLFGEEIQYTIPAHPLNRKGTARGQMVGGNLSILYSLSATPSDLETEGKILLIEDVDEYLYHIDRMMMNLKRSCKLNNLAGLIVGGMTKMNDNAIPFGRTAEETISAAVSEYDYPVCFGFPAGHQEQNNTLILGRETELSVNEDSLLRFVGKGGKDSRLKNLKMLLLPLGGMFLFFALLYLLYALVIRR